VVRFCPTILVVEALGMVKLLLRAGLASVRHWQESFDVAGRCARCESWCWHDVFVRECFDFELIYISGNIQ